MAAKAGPENTASDEIWYSEVVALLAARCGGVEFAEQRLVAGLKDGRVPWSHLRKDGRRIKGDAAFWRRSETSILNINRAENSAGYSELIAGTVFWPRDNSAGYFEPVVRSSDLPDDVSGIKVSRTAALALLPSAPPTAPVKRRSGPQINRVRKALPRLYPPDGKVPVGTTVETVWSKVVAELKADSKARNLNDPSPDVVDAVIKEIGRRDD